VVVLTAVIVGGCTVFVVEVAIAFDANAPFGGKFVLSLDRGVVVVIGCTPA
jgi:hypothetical protein